MDQLSTSDLLILSSSYYSALAAALQRAKHAFTLLPKDREDFDLPGMIRGSNDAGASVRITKAAVLQPYSIE